MTPAEAARAAWSAIFDEREWVRLPLGRACYRATLRPCGDCGNPTFLVLVRTVVDAEAGTRRTDLRVVCGSDACARRIRRRDDEREVGVLDMATGTYTHHARSRAR
jgi:hypothetical protein